MTLSFAVTGGCEDGGGASGSCVPAVIRVTYLPSGDHVGNTVVKIAALVLLAEPRMTPGCQMVNVELPPGLPTG